MNDTTIPQGYKKCSKCGAVLPATADHFRKRKDSFDGWRGQCKFCQRTHFNEWCKTSPTHATWKETHREQIRRDNRKQNARRKGKRAEYFAEHYRRNRERKRQYIKDNLQHLNEYNREYRKQHPIRRRQFDQKKRAKRMLAEGHFTREDILAQKSAQTDKKGILHCWWCDEPLNDDWHIDHRIPLTKGGTNNADNIVLTHPSCNMRKHNKMPWEFNGRLI